MSSVQIFNSYITISYAILLLQLSWKLAANKSNQQLQKWENEHLGIINHAELEELDEKKDKEVLRAVWKSMKNWRKNKKRRTKRENRVVCYGDLGCFSSEGPFNYLDTLPSPPEDIGTRFLLYSRKNVYVPEEMEHINERISNGTHFDPTKLIKILIHGFGSNCERYWALEMRESLLKEIDCSVICVDWEKGANLPNYVRASVNTRLVGKQVAMFISALRNTYNISIPSIHLIGFSLGAHVSGFTGNAILEKQGEKLKRITGPLFETYDGFARLDESDAEFVDVIHSNGESILMGGLGAWEPMGTIDFYPNGGKEQKGCSNFFLGSISDLFISSGKYFRKAKEALRRFPFLAGSNGESKNETSSREGKGLCNHRRAYKFFTHSIMPKCQFPAFECKSYEHFLIGECFPCGKNGIRCGKMGYYADESNAKGKLYLVTRESEPFCANQFKITIQNFDNQEFTYGKMEVLFFGTKGYNESFQLTRDERSLLRTNEVFKKIIVPHPIIEEGFQIQILYSAYSGWLQSGTKTWSINGISIMDSHGKISCFNNPITLKSGVAETLHVRSNCPESGENIWNFPSLKLIPPPFSLDKAYNNNTLHFNSSEVINKGHETEIINYNKNNKILNTNFKMSFLNKVMKTSENSPTNIFENYYNHHLYNNGKVRIETPSNKLSFPRTPRFNKITDFTPNLFIMPVNPFHLTRYIPIHLADKVNKFPKISRLFQSVEPR